LRRRFAVSATLTAYRGVRRPRSCGSQMHAERLTDTRHVITWAQLHRLPNRQAAPDGLTAGVYRPRSRGSQMNAERL